MKTGKSRYIDREVKMGIYCADSPSYIHPRTISTTILGSAVKNNNDDSTRDKKYYCGNKEVSL